MIRAAATGGVDIDWGAFGVVFGVALVAAVVVVVAAALALRLFAVGSADDTGPEGHEVSAAAGARPASATAGGVLLLAVAAGVVLYGLWLIIPQFH